MLILHCLFAWCRRYLIHHMKMSFGVIKFWHIEFFKHWVFKLLVYFSLIFLLSWFVFPIFLTFSTIFPLAIDIIFLAFHALVQLLQLIGEPWISFVLLLFISLTIIVDNCWNSLLNFCTSWNNFWIF